MDYSMWSYSRWREPAGEPAVSYNSGRSRPTDEHGVESTKMMNSIIIIYTIIYSVSPSPPPCGMQSAWVSLCVYHCVGRGVNNEVKAVVT